MRFLKTSFLLLLPFLLVLGCTKTIEPNDPPVVPPPAPNTNKPTGIIYLNVEGDFVKINANDSAILWTSANRNLAGSAFNPLTFDSTTFYFGNAGGLTSYSTVTGTPRWQFFWVTSSDAHPYREPAINDSLLFVTTPTSMWDHAYLYCLKKSTGVMRWRKKIDNGFVDRPFNSTPMVIDGKVIVMVRDAANHTQLSAFKADDASPLWTSAINDSLSSLNLIYSGGKIYSRSHRNLYCYSTTDGSLHWQTDMQQPSFKNFYFFFEGDKLILVKVESNKYTTVVLNTATGSIIKTTTFTVPTQLPIPANAHRSCNYSNNTLYVTSAHNSDTVSIKAYDLLTATMKWEKRYAIYYFAYFDPVLTDKYLIFPINNSYPAGKSFMYFLDLNGKYVTDIPFNGNYTNSFVYAENGVTYKVGHLYSNR